MPLFRRHAPNALVAAATEIRVDDWKQARHYRQTRQARQQEAFDRYDQVGEIWYSTRWLADQISKLRLFPAVIEDPTREPVQIDKNNPLHDRAWKALERLQMPYGSHAPLLRAWAMNWVIAGECFLLALKRGTLEEEWMVKSVFEVEPSGTGGWRLLEDPLTGEPRQIGPQDFLVRLWIQHPRNASMADSPVMGILDPAEEILLLSQTVRAIARSRLHAGILKVPSELSFGAIDPSQEGDPTKDPFIMNLHQGLSAPIKDVGTSGAVVPVTIKGPADYLKALEHIPLERPFDEQIDKLRERALRRLAQGLPVPVEVVTGMGDLSHWNAWFISESSFTQHIEPFVDAMMDSLTLGYFWPAMGVKKPEPGVPVLWYDHSRLVTRPDRTKDYQDAHDRGAISDDAYRRGMGFPDSDKPDDEEIARRILFQRSNVDPIITEVLMKLVDPDFSTPRSDGQIGPGMRGEVPKTKNEGKGGMPEESAPREPSGSNTVPADDVLSASANSSSISPHAERLVGAFDAACRRALEKAGARLRSRAQKDEEIVQVIAASPNFKVAAILGPDRVERLGVTEDKLIEGSFSDLKEQFFTWGRKWGCTPEDIHPAWLNVSGRLFTTVKHALYDPPGDLEPFVEPIAQAAVEELGLLTKVS